MGRKKSPRRNNQQNRSNRARGYNGQPHRQHQDRYGKGAFAAGEQLSAPKKKKARWRGGNARPEQVAAIARICFGGLYYCVGTGNESQEEPPWEQMQAV